MAAFSISIFTAIAIAILRCASAVSTDNSNYTTTFVLPDQLFIPVPDSTTFVGQMTINSSTTYYTVNCGHDSNFFPYPCSDGPSYTFSASSATTQYLIADVNLDILPFLSASTAAQQLQNFAQNITVNCGTLNAASSVNCVYTTIYNKESPHDQSIISPTYVSRTTTIAQSSLYPFTFTNVTVSATAAATPQNSLATPTTPPNNIPTTISPSSTSTTSTSPSKAPPTTLPPHPHSPPLTPGAKAGIGISVPLGILALCGLGLLLYRHKRHKENSRASQTENFLQAEGYVAENEGKDVPAPDNSGVYEMQERGSLDRGGVHELG